MDRTILVRSDVSDPYAHEDLLGFPARVPRAITPNRNHGRCSFGCTMGSVEPSYPQASYKPASKSCTGRCWERSGCRLRSGGKRGQQPPYPTLGRFHGWVNPPGRAKTRSSTETSLQRISDKPLPSGVLGVGSRLDPWCTAYEDDPSTAFWTSARFRQRMDCEPHPLS